jgi:WG containing repeat
MVWTVLACILALTLPQANPPSLHAFAAKGKYGFKDDDGAVRISAKYDDAEDFAEGLAAVAVLEGTEVYEGGEFGKNCLVKARKWGFIDSTGRPMIPLKYSQARSFSEGKAAVRSGAKWGFIDRNDQWVVQPRFAAVEDFEGGFARVSLTTDGESGYINTSGALVVPARFERYDTAAADGVASVQNRQGRSALFDRNGRVIVTKQGTLRLLGEGMVAYRDFDRGPYGLMDVRGTVIAPPT